MPSINFLNAKHGPKCWNRARAKLFEGTEDRLIADSVFRALGEPRGDQGLYAVRRVIDEAPITKQQRRRINRYVQHRLQPFARAAEGERLEARSPARPRPDA